MQDDVHGRSRATSRRAAASGWIGSALEYYDFFIYAQAAALIFPTVFFPAGNATVGLIASLATYAVGYVARPLGAFVLGHWGDKYGRKNVLVLAMLTMGVSTCAVALLPTYEQVGIAAPILLVVVRLVQGFTVAGELSGASAMIVEHAPFGRRGYYASFTLQGTQIGQVIAAAIFLPLSAVLPEHAFTAWGWRIPFLLSFVVLIAGYLIRRRVEETPAFLAEETHEQPRRAPIPRVLRENWANIVRAIGMTLVNAVGTTVVVFGEAYATQEGYGIGMSATLYLWIPVVANIVAAGVIPYFGNLADKVGRRPILIIGSLGSGALSYAYLYAISQHNVVLTLGIAIVMWGLLFQMWNATFASFFQELFPTRNRVTGFAVSQNIGLCLVAFMPSLFTLVAPPGSGNVPLVVGSISFGVTIIGAIAAWSSRETHRIRLADLDHSDAEPVSREEFDRDRAMHT